MRYHLSIECFGIARLAVDLSLSAALVANVFALPNCDLV
ncbi:hypothetical protein ACVWW6_009006 [Bradyrhizobium sp. USDA 3311]